MIIILGRNKVEGKTAAVIESINDKIYLNTYKQKNGISNLKTIVESIELDDDRIKSIVEYYARLKN